MKREMKGTKDIHSKEREGKRRRKSKGSSQPNDDADDIRESNLVSAAPAAVPVLGTAAMSDKGVDQLL